MVTPMCRSTLGTLAKFLPLVWLAVGVAHGQEVDRAAPVSAPKGADDAVTLYVSPSGNDHWSGRFDQPNRDGTDGPLATIQGARDAVRELKTASNGLKAPVTIMLRAGVYPQDEPIVFTPADSGTDDCPITYQAFQGESVIISGGKIVQGWQIDDSEHNRTRCEGRLWKAVIPDAKTGGTWRFNQLFVNGQRRIRARSPNKGEFFRTDGPVSKDNSREFYFNEGDIKEWDRLRDAIIVVYHSWETSLHHIRSLDTQANIVTLHEPAPWPMGRWERKQRYYVENVFEALDEPGEWYLNRETGTLYYYPLPGETMTHVKVVAPIVTSTLVRFDGDAPKGGTIEHLYFKGISFCHSNAELKRLRNPGQGEIYQSAMIAATGLRHSGFQRCTVAHTGAHGIWFADGCEDNVVRQCHIHDLGGGGVYIGGGWGLHEAAPTRRITVDNNFIHDGGHLFHGAHGVWIGRSSYNEVTHNEISNFDYSGISCGWSWGFQPSSAHHNHLDYNHIHHLGNGDGLSDMGGIYTLGISPGTTERFNRIHHIYSYAHVSHGSGIYPDEGSSNILIENNIVYRVRTCPLFQHYGKDNIIRNNIFALGGKGQLQRCREDKPCHYVAEGNIVYGDIQQMLGGVWKNGDWKIGRNIYWSTSGPPRFTDRDFEAWKAAGNDVGSLVADPLFVDVSKDDFRLKPGSPALKLGFRPIDPSQSGLYGDRSWVDLPKQYANRPLNEVPPPVEEPFVVNFDFENDRPGEEPLDVVVISGGKKGSVVVSADTAADGKQSLKFTDSPGLQYGWAPHLYCRPSYTNGIVKLSWDMLNSAEAPAGFYVEVRQWNVSPYLVGPTVSVSRDGQVTVGRQAIGAIPLGKWVHVDIDMDLGEGKPKTYRCSLTVPGREPMVVEVPYLNEAFESVTWLGISSTSDAATVFYVDNLKLGTPDELAAPKQRRRRPRPAQREPRAINNDDLLAGHWNFDEGEGYVACDRSGCANDGDVWASWAKGTFGSAIFRDALSSHVIVPDDPTLHFGTSSFSIALWICPTQLEIDSPDRRRRFMSKDRYPETWWNLNVTTDGTPFLEMTDSNRVSWAARPSGKITENKWTHFAVVVDRQEAAVRYYPAAALQCPAGVRPTGERIAPNRFPTGRTQPP